MRLLRSLPVIGFIAPGHVPGALEPPRVVLDLGATTMHAGTGGASTTAVPVGATLGGPALALCAIAPLRRDLECARATGEAPRPPYDTGA